MKLQIVGVAFKCPYCGLKITGDNAFESDKLMTLHIKRKHKRWW